MSFKDLSGKKFSRLTVVKKSHSDKRGASHWLCKCDCGEIKTIRGSSLISQRTKSCGCLNLENITKHGMSRSREYHIWEGMIQRCEHTNDPSYNHYGGRGIVVSKEWHDFESFFNDIGEIPVGFEIDRIDNDKNYCKSNCKISTRKEQMQNMRTSKRWYILGKTFYSSRDAAKALGISRSQVGRNCNGYTHSQTHNWVPPKPGWSSELKYKEDING